MPHEKITLLKSLKCYTKSLQRGHAFKMFVLIKKTSICLKLGKRIIATYFIKKEKKSVI